MWTARHTNMIYEIDVLTALNDNDLLECDACTLVEEPGCGVTSQKTILNTNIRLYIIMSSV
jgi:hypothetical protein